MDLTLPSTDSKRIDSDKSFCMLRNSLVTHPLFSQVQSIQQLRLFMESHVFAVWDFMSLLKTLQNQLTCTTVPWLPPANPLAARLINEIVLGEETDEILSSTFISHFELYLRAMENCGANTRVIQSFLDSLGKCDIETALLKANAPAAVIPFVISTMNFCGMKPHETAAAFFFGREDIIPEMFQRILSTSGALQATEGEMLRLYLNRHIEIDGGSHGPMAERLMDCLCKQDEEKWIQARVAAKSALTARKKLWDRVLDSLIANKFSQ